jgi:hypothetical protein
MTTRTLFVILLLVAASVFAEPIALSPAPFRMRVIDANTGEGVPNLRITTDNGIVCYTMLDGSAAFGESSLMGRAVRFQIEDETHRFNGLDATIRVERRTRTNLTVTAR